MSIKVSELFRWGRTRTTNPTTIQADGVAVQDPMFDSHGRLITYPYTVRDLISTASVTLANNAADNETTLIAADSTQFNDLLFVQGVNTSDQAIRVVFRDVAGGADLITLQMAASSSANIQFRTPWKQSGIGDTWKVDFDTATPNDVTNTTVRVFAQFIKNK